MDSTNLIPQKYKKLSGSVLKMIALITMLIDHTAAVILSQCEFANITLFTINYKVFSLYSILRLIGRLAFPIYCFLLIEGYLHTHDKKKYGLNLLIFAVISEIPWNLEHTGEIFYRSQNVFFTLFLGYLGIYFYEYYKNNLKNQIVILTLLMIFAYFFRADYGCLGFGFILLLYFFKSTPLTAIIGSCFFTDSIAIFVSFIIMNLYNGERGFIKGKAKYLFYIAYPLHILILYFLRVQFFGGY